MRGFLLAIFAFSIFPVMAMAAPDCQANAQVVEKVRISEGLRSGDVVEYDAVNLMVLETDCKFMKSGHLYLSEGGEMIGYMMPGMVLTAGVEEPGMFDSHKTLLWHPIVVTQPKRVKLPAGASLKTVAKGVKAKRL